jgi:hypothetical protein
MKWLTLITPAALQNQAFWGGIKAIFCFISNTLFAEKYMMKG